MCKAYSGGCTLYSGTYRTGSMLHTVLFRATFGKIGRFELDESAREFDVPSLRILKVFLAH